MKKTIITEAESVLYTGNKKAYDARFDSIDYRRPLLNKLYKKANGTSTYELINILTKYPKTDTYVLRNVSTGKISSAKRIIEL